MSALTATGLATGLATADPAAAAAPPASGQWTVDWASGITFGAVGNVGSHAVADCAVASVADIEQVIHHESTPRDPQPYLAAYAKIARSEGEEPSASSGLIPSDVLRRWERTGIAGDRITAAAPVPTSVARIEAALQRGPVYAVVDLPRTTSTAPVWVDDAGVALRTWSPATPPGGYAGSGAHVVAVVGYGPAGVLLATWGYVQPVSWAEWAALATQAWSVTP